MTLYLKYRPQTIEDLDLQSVRESLKKTLASPNIPHAFLFAGPKGTGKTSAARIVAKALNCDPNSLKLRGAGGVEPCNECSTCIAITRGESLDCLEIDAASHRGIDDIRTLRDAVKLSPVSSKYKVYIIDEAHMLTTEASNALLKILEEPPAHVIFILATTNPEKLIDTIRSRTTLIQFTKATEADVVRRLIKVARGEAVPVDDEVLKLIAKAADGAFRDAVKIFEQVLSGQIELTEISVNEFLFGVSSFDANVFIQTLLKKEAKDALSQIEHGIEQGVSAKIMTKGILDNLRMQMLESITNSKSQREVTIELLDLFSKAYAEIPQSYLEQLPLEIVVVKWCTDREDNREQRTEEGVEKGSGGTHPKAESAPAEVKSKLQMTNKQSLQFHCDKYGEGDGKEIEKKKLTKETDAVVRNSEIFPDATWVKVLSEIREKSASTEALLRVCKPLGFDGKTLTVGVFYKFHKEKLEIHPHRDLLEKVLGELLKSPIRILCVLTDPPLKKIQEEVLQNNNVVLTETKNNDTIIVQAAKDIFGA